MKISSAISALAALASCSALAHAKHMTDCSANVPDATTSAPASSVGSDSSASASDSASDSASGSGSSSSGLASLPVVAPVASCADLASMDLTSIGGAGSAIDTAAETTSGNVTYCAVNGKLDTNVTFTVLLPKATWTQRFLFTGCGGLCGSDALSQGPTDSSGHFAMAATDMAGGNDGTFGLIRDRRLAFAYNANHWVTVTAKQLIKTYYGQAQKYAYFSGCSDGGREAVMEALRYPDDFNGIVAGAPAFLFQLQNTFHHGWLARSNTADDGTHPLQGSRLSILHDAVMDACDALDGLKDGLLSDPRLCSFDASTIQCASDASNTTCLTSTEVGVIKKIFQGPVDATTGQHLTVGEEQYGSELAWEGVFVPASTSSGGAGAGPSAGSGSTAGGPSGGSTAGGPSGGTSSGSSTLMSESTALAVLKYLAFEVAPPSNYTLSDLEFSLATLDKLKVRHPLFDAISPDLSAFHKAGGKLILYHGWADPHITPRGTIAFHEALQKQLGKSTVEEFERLYLLPGVYHCGDGYGFSTYDFLTPMQQWIESSTKPDAVIVSTGNGATVARSRPVYPYPYLPKYKGSGNDTVASSYTKGSAMYTNLTASWAGESWYDKYTPIEG